MRAVSNPPPSSVGLVALPSSTALDSSLVLLYLHISVVSTKNVFHLFWGQTVIPDPIGVSFLQIFVFEFFGFFFSPPVSIMVQS